MRNARLLKHFNSWLAFTERVQRVKAMTRYALAGQLEHCFSTWVDFVDNRLEMR